VQCPFYPYATDHLHLELFKTYASGVHALSHINLDIRRGEIFALLKPASKIKRNDTERCLKTPDEFTRRQLSFYQVFREPNEVACREPTDEPITAGHVRLLAGEAVTPFAKLFSWPPGTAGIHLLGIETMPSSTRICTN